MKIKKSLMVIALVTLSGVAMSDSPYLVDPNTGKFLGNLNSNKYDPNSVSNPYGRYGNPYSPDSINNPYGRYGSPYSSDSVNNPYSSGGPVIKGR